MNLSTDRVRELLASAKKKMYAARLQRPTPYVDKTVYVGWNSMCVTAYLEAARVLGLEEARHFALRSLDRILAEAWKANSGVANRADEAPAAAWASANPASAALAACGGLLRSCCGGSRGLRLA
jgi:uncharacterized protein YyaL (SSP411 family)